MSPRTILFVGNFFFSIVSGFSLYVLLPFLSTLMSDVYTGLVVAASGLVALVLFPLMPRLAARYGAQQLALIFSLVEMIALFVLAAAPGIIASVILVIIAVTLQPFLYYELDLLLEASGATEGSTGRVRASFLTAWNMGAFIAPLFIGALLASSDAYGNVFVAAAAAATPLVLLFAIRRLPHGEMTSPARLRDTIACILCNRDLVAVTLGNLVLYLFYVWAPLYAPIYLHTVLGFSWSDLGWIFSIMLIPYVLIEYPAGWIADKYLGDKEMMFAGFLIAGGALASIGLLTSASPLLLILCVLLTSRAGAALVEAMTAGHFFRRVSERDVNSISIFRGVWPLSYLVAPIIGSVILYFGNYQLLFFITGGFVVLAGITATLFVKDFK